MDPRELSERLCGDGAILHLVRHQCDVLVGYWEWLGDHRVFFFEAALEDEFGAHFLDFESATVLAPDRIEFLDNAGKLIAVLFPLTAAGDDAEAYAKTWQDWSRWREVMLPFIRAVKQSLMR